MNIKFVILIILLPNMRVVSSWMRNKDLNDTGIDDEVADALDFAIQKIEKWAMTPVPAIEPFSSKSAKK